MCSVCSFESICAGIPTSSSLNMMTLLLKSRPDDVRFAFSHSNLYACVCWIFDLNGIANFRERYLSFFIQIKKKPFLYGYIKTTSSNELSFLSQVVALPPCHQFEFSFLSQVPILQTYLTQIYIIHYQKIIHCATYP